MNVIIKFFVLLLNKNNVRKYGIEKVGTTIWYINNNMKRAG